MPVPRRDFMKLFGISLGSLLLARCQRMATPSPTIMQTCYQPTAVPMTPESATPKNLSARDRARLCWLRFGELAQKTRDAASHGDGDDGVDRLRTQLIADHRTALDDLVAEGELTAPVADLVQRAYGAAAYHIWRSNAPMTCYEMASVDYAPASANNLVYQSEALDQVAAGSTIVPETLAKVRAALEHDLAFYALSDAEIQELYARLAKEYQTSGEKIPTFEEVELTLTPDVKAAAQFLLDLLVVA